MKPSYPAVFARSNPYKHRRGFALVSTLLLMMVLVILALGLLNLSAISLRNTGQQLWQAEARSNARLAMMLALGQLQEAMGPDARISASSAILDSDPSTPNADGVASPRLTGVWNAATSKVANFQLDSGPDKKTFRTWLTSGDPATLTSQELAKSGYPGDAETRSLVAAGSDASKQRKVSVPVMSANKNQAGFAWWISDDGAKATLRPGEKPDGSSKGNTMLAMRRSGADGHSVLTAQIPKRDNGLDQRFVDVASADAALTNPPGDSRIASKYIHDLTTNSEIIPIDVTTSSLRKCLNARLDWLESQSPAARAAEGTVGPRGSSAAQDYRLCSWDQLRNYESLARPSSMVASPSGRPMVRTYKQTGYTNSNGEPEWNANIGGDRYRVQPVLLKYSFVVSYSTELLTSPADPNKPYALRMFLYPMVVLWNPYNVDLQVPEYCVSGYCPLTFDINKGKPDYFKLDLTQNQSATMLAFGPQMGGADKTLGTNGLIIPAGTTKVLYPQPVRWQTNPEEHRNGRFIWHYYMWGQSNKFDLGDSNFGGILKNLRGNQSVAYFTSQPTNEIAGAAGDSVSIAVSPSSAGASYTFGLGAEHTDWWGNNGTGDDNAETLQKFGASTSAAFRIEGATPQISLIADGELPSRTYGQLQNRPTPLLLFEYYRKGSDEDLFPAKHGSFSISTDPITGRTDSSMGNNDAVTPWFESPYSFRFKAINSWFDVTKTFSLPANRDDCVYFGRSYSPSGQLSVVDQEIPLSPLVSLAQLQHLPLFDYRPIYDPKSASGTTIWYGGDYGFHEGRVTQFPQNHAIGNSYASPGIPAGAISNPGWNYTFNIEGVKHLRMDRSYIANSVLWDSWFCSSVAAQDGSVLTQDTSRRSARQVFQDFVKGTTPLPNDAMQAHLTEPQDAVIGRLFSGDVPTKDAYTQIARYLRIHGGFNVNSVSVDAWAHFLSGLLSRPSMVMKSASGKESPTVVDAQTDKFLISRYTLANDEPAERANGPDRENRYWNGSREVTADQIRELATAIVRQVKKRGPFTSLAEFVNRRLGNDESLAVSGALQSALDDDSVSINAPFRGDTITNTNLRPNYAFPAAARGPRRQGITGYVTQADLLQTIGSSISPRSDTFTIRALGESRDAKGNILARAWCEAVVQRNVAYVNPADSAKTAFADLTQDDNKKFGRRFELVSFRWLNRNEVE